MPPKVDELALSVEAVLFASGKPLSVREISDALGLHESRPVQIALKTLQQTYGNRQTALELRRVGDRYALQLVERFVTTVQSVTPVEMAPRTLKALTLIAYHQPILQSMLVRMIGDSTYEEVQRLRGMGLIHTEAKGSTLELTTTRRFAEYFGISSTKPEEIRKFLEDKLGVKPTSPVSPPEASLVAPPSAPAAPPEAGPADEAVSVGAAAMARDDPTEAPG
ncbi:MAG: SMC-Scp complex subunit ScpB [Thermoplasmata archaeon]|jgi:segregation and condensation protein B